MRCWEPSDTTQVKRTWANLRSQHHSSEAAQLVLNLVLFSRDSCAFSTCLSLLVQLVLLVLVWRLLLLVSPLLLLLLMPLLVLLLLVLGIGSSQRRNQESGMSCHCKLLSLLLLFSLVFAVVVVVVVVLG